MQRNSAIIEGMPMRHSSRVLRHLVAIWSAAATAHHSFGSVYDTGTRVRLTGVVREFQFINPHPYLIVAVDGRTWRAEMDNRFELADIGVTAQTFKPGDEVVLNGSPGRSEARILYLWRLDRPADGLRYEQVGSIPSLHLP
jgi:hypothetical protein